MDVDQITEIVIKYKNGKSEIYRGKKILSFIEEVLESFELSGDETVQTQGLKYSTPTSDGTPMPLQYKIEKNRSPAEVAREMQKQAAGKLLM